jgi:hypothetical protein
MDACTEASRYGLAMTLALRDAANDAVHERWLTWPVSRKEAWYNNHGTGMHWKTADAAKHLLHVRTEYATLRCKDLFKEIEELQACIEKTSTAKDWSVTCKGAFWDE